MSIVSLDLDAMTYVKVSLQNFRQIKTEEDTGDTKSYSKGIGTMYEIAEHRNFINN